MYVAGSRRLKKALEALKRSDVGTVLVKKTKQRSSPSNRYRCAACGSSLLHVAVVTVVYEGFDQTLISGKALSSSITLR